MSYVVFKFNPNSYAEDRIKSLSVLFLTIEEQLKGYDGWLTKIDSKAIDKLNLFEMITLIACRVAKVPSITVIKFPNEFDTDKHFIDSFGDNYLGMLSGNIKKLDLLEHCTRLRKYTERRYFNGYGTIHLAGLQKQMDEVQFDELTKIVKKSVEPINNWIDDWIKEAKTELDELPIPIKRNF